LGLPLKLLENFLFLNLLEFINFLKFLANMAIPSSSSVYSSEEILLLPFAALRAMNLAFLIGARKTHKFEENL